MHLLLNYPYIDYTPVQNYLNYLIFIFVACQAQTLLSSAEKCLKIIDSVVQTIDI